MVVFFYVFLGLAFRKKGLENGVRPTYLTKLFWFDKLANDTPE
jgi:hypothetical protein